MAWVMTPNGWYSNFETGEQRAPDSPPPEVAAGAGQSQSADPAARRNALVARHGFTLLPRGILLPVGKGADFAALQADPAFSSDKEFARSVHLATAKDRLQLADKNGPGNNEGGSDLSNIMKGMGFILGGSSLAGMLGAPGMTAMQTLSGAMPSFSNPFSSLTSATGGAAPDASWGVNPQGGGMDEFERLIDQFYGGGEGGSGGVGGNLDQWGNPIDGSDPFTAPASPGEVMGSGAGGGYGGYDYPDMNYEAPGQPGGGGPMTPAELARMDPGFMELVKKYGLQAAKAIMGGNGAGGAAGGAGGLFNPDGSLNMASLMGMLGRAAPGVLGAFASSQQGDLQRELAAGQRQAEQTRYDDLTRRESERFQTLQGREDTAISRQDQYIKDMIARESGRFDVLRGREDAAIGRQQEAMQFGRGVGQPSRDRFEGSFRPGFTMADDPGFMDALNQSSKATLHGLSVNGNPAGSPNAWAQSLRDNYEKVAYPAMKDYRTMNANTGGYGSYAGGGASVPGIGSNLPGSVPSNIPGIGSSLPGSTSIGSTTGSQVGSGMDSSAIGSQGSIFNSLGAAASNVFSPQKSLLDQLKEFKTMMGP